MSLSSCDPDIFVYVTSNLHFSGNVPDPVDSFHEIFESLYDEETARKAKEIRQRPQREAEAKKKAQAEAEARAKRKRDEKERKARAKAEEERRRREREEDEAEQL